MGTITRTYNDNPNQFADQVGIRKTWTVLLTYTDNVNVTGSTFSLTSPTLQMKFAYISTPQTGWSANYNAEAGMFGQVKIGGTDASWALAYGRPNMDFSYFVDGSPNTYYTVTKQQPSGASPHTQTFNTSTFFTSSNKTSKTLSIVYTGSLAGITDVNSTMSGYTTCTMNTGEVSFTMGTITLNAPPVVELGTPTYNTPHYTGLGEYSVPITSATAKYGGDITSIKLTIGADSVVQNYSTSTVSNQTISLTPTQADTYTPTITVTDSRGQTKTESLPQITVNLYNVPSTSFDVYRTDEDGIKNDEGHYALIQSTISYTDAIATLVEPSIQIDGDDLSSLTDASVTWYKTWNNTSGVSNVISDWTTLVPQNHMVTIYGLIDWDYDTTGNFAEDTSYQITLVANDSFNGHSTPITQTMSTAYYTIDFQAGGKEIAFGAPANDSLTEHPNGLFKCNMDAVFKEGVVVERLVGEIKMFAGTTIPTGWLLCDGSEVEIADYPLLYDAIGNFWGVASDSDHFKLPNFVGRMPLGASDINTTEWVTITGENEYSSFTLDAPTYARWGTGTTWLYKTLAPGTYYPTYSNMNTEFGGDPASGTAKCIQVALNVGGNGGYSWWRPSANDMPIHNHTQDAHNHFSGLHTVPDRFGAGSRDAAGAYTGYSGQVAIYTDNRTPAIQNSGGGRYISQMPPFAVVNYIICAV